jgi:hypothetical protein
MGYVSNKKPVLLQRVEKEDNRVRYYYRLNTFTFSSFTWIYDLFYAHKTKHVSEQLELYLTPVSLAYWAGGDGTRVGKAFAFCTNSFTKAECELLVKMLNRKFGLTGSVQGAGDKKKEQFRTYIDVSSTEILRALILPHLTPSMHYKLGIKQ